MQDIKRIFSWFLYNSVPEITKWQDLFVKKRKFEYTTDMNNTLFSEETRQFTLKVCIVLAILGIGWILYSLQSVIFLFGGAIFVSLLLSPFVDYFSRLHIRKWHVPDIMAIFMSFWVVLIFVSLFVVAIVPIFVDLGNNTKQALGRWVETIQAQVQDNFPFLDTLPLNAGKMIRNQFDTQTLSDFLLSKEKSAASTSALLGNIDSIQSFAQKWFWQVSNLWLSFASGVTSGIVYAILFILVTFFTLLERKQVLKLFFRTLPHNLSQYFKHREDAVSNAVHSWLKGQLKLSWLMFLINLIGLWIVSLFWVPVHNIFALALIAWLAESVPYAGPVITFVTAFLMVLVSPDSSMSALITICILYVIFQQIEGNIMVPMVMSKTMDLSALYILLMTLAGATLWGVVWVLIAVPLASILHIFYMDWMHYRKHLEEIE